MYRTSPLITPHSPQDPNNPSSPQYPNNPSSPHDPKSFTSSQLPDNDDSDDGEEEDEGISSSLVPESTHLIDRSSGPTGYLSDVDQTKSQVEVKEDKYPRAVLFIVGNEFCERFSYYGMRAILTLYLKYELMFNEDKATVLFHAWCMLCYFTPVIGAVIADSFLGRYKTILYISIIYLIGNSVLSIAAIPPIFDTLSEKLWVSVTGLILIGLGTGGIKPCVAAFGGDQFKLPQQQKQLSTFFSVFYFSINAGSLLSTLITPVLREDVHCFMRPCYPLAFGLPAALMIVALGLFICGSSSYKKLPPEGNVVMSVGRCIALAIKQKVLRGESRHHWLDHAKGSSCSASLIQDVKILMRVLVLFLPLPVFWALFDQQGSRWTFQAVRMNGSLGSYTIKPDQMQVLNPLMILILVPIFEGFIYPKLSKFNILTQPLHRMATGGLIAASAFIAATILELQLETSTTELHMLWLFPQYFLITVGEIMFSITGLEFSFTQAPPSMKSVVQAAWLLTVSFGNLIVVLIAEAKFFQRQSMEFFLFALLMVIDMIVFLYLAARYEQGKQDDNSTFVLETKLNVQDSDSHEEYRE